MIVDWWLLLSLEYLMENQLLVVELVADAELEYMSEDQLLVIG